MQDAGMRTAQLDQIVCQKDPELLRAVEHLAKNETKRGVALLREQGRVTEIPNGTERIQAIARDYASKPESTIIVSPNNKSRQQLNDAVRVELKEKGILSGRGETFQTLTNRNDMTGAERTWAARYEVGNILHYTTGSKAEGIAKNSYATVRSVDAAANRALHQCWNGDESSWFAQCHQAQESASGELMKPGIRWFSSMLNESKFSLYPSALVRFLPSVLSLLSLRDIAILGILKGRSRQMYPGAHA